MNQKGFKWVLLVVLAVIVWFALIAQLVLIIQNRVVSIPETILRFFCYFTILSNILAGLAVTYQLLLSDNKIGRHMRKQSTLAAVVVYIAVVCIVYNVALRGLIEMKGLQRVVDELLHVAVPVLYVLFWIFYAGKRTLQWKNAIRWLRFPFFYLLAVMCAGSVLTSKFYPYPFLDAYNHGYPKVIIAAIVILLLFLLLSFLIIGFAKLAVKKDG